MQEWINLISNVGFPITIALYVLFRLEKTVQENTRAIREMIIILRGK